MFKRARTDDNQSPVVRRLRQIGCSVLSLAPIGSGCPDLLIGYHGLNTLLEVKDGEKAPSARKLTGDQVRFKSEWRGQWVVVTSPDEAMEAVVRLTTGRGGAVRMVWIVDVPMVEGYRWRRVRGKSGTEALVRVYEIKDRGKRSGWYVREAEDGSGLEGTPLSNVTESGDWEWSSDVFHLPSEKGGYFQWSL